MRRATPDEVRNRWNVVAEEFACGNHPGRYAAFEAAATRLGTCQANLRLQFKREGLDLPFFKRPDPELVLKGTSVLSKDGVEIGRWDKTRTRGRLDEDVVHLPDPKAITRVSTLYDQMGEVTQQWVQEKPAETAKAALWEEFARGLAADLPRVGVLEEPRAPLNKHLMALYPIGDHHMGMLSWKHETGASYDLDIGERLLTSAIAHLVPLAPPCEEAVVVFVGDYMHYDSFESVTPTNRNPLDADGRFPKMVHVAARTMRRVIETAAARHKNVRVIVEFGNHDPVSSVFLMVFLAAVYENNPRILIDTSPRHYHYFSFGKNAFGVHHGHETKPADLPLIMATDQPEMWGSTTYRYWLTGHIHKQTVYDFPGCSVESLRILPPNDAWAAHSGYRSHRGMKALIYHTEHGEVARHTVNPAMLETPI